MAEIRKEPRRYPQPTFAPRCAHWPPSDRDSDHSTQWCERGRELVGPAETLLESGSLLLEASGLLLEAVDEIDEFLTGDLAVGP